MTTPFPVSRAHELPEHVEESRWLIDGLWSEEAVGIVGGEPKCCKSFLALDLAISVASETPCLRRFPVPRGGRVLLFAAEDSEPVVRQRLEGIARAAGVELPSLDIHVIRAPKVRLDSRDDRCRLMDTVATVSPKLLILDPFVRLHQVDENVSAEVAPLLGFLRDVQREQHTAVALVHHARKGAGKTRDGQALRGTSEFHAWGDSNLYVRRQGERILLAIEHRAAPSSTGLPLRLADRGVALALEVVESQATPPTTSPASHTQRVERALSETPLPLGRDALRRACRLRSSSLTEALVDLTRRGRVSKVDGGYCLASR